MDKLLINEPPHQVLPTLATAVGLDVAIFTQQLHWLLSRPDRDAGGFYWVVKTIPEWLDVFPYWKERTMRRIIKKARETAVVVATTEYNESKIDKTLWYRIDYDVLTSDDFGNPSGQNGRSALESRPAKMADSPLYINTKNKSVHASDDFGISTGQNGRSVDEFDEWNSGEHPALLLWAKVAVEWPGVERAKIIKDRLGERPSEETLRAAYRLWIGAGYSRRNVDGILDWYHNLSVDPGWRPRSQAGPAKKTAVVVDASKYDTSEGAF